MVHKGVIGVGKTRAEAENGHIAVGKIIIARLNAEPLVHFDAEFNPVEKSRARFVDVRQVKKARAKSGVEINAMTRDTKRVSPFAKFAFFRSISAASLRAGTAPQKQGDCECE